MQKLAKKKQTDIFDDHLIGTDPEHELPPTNSCWARNLHERSHLHGKISKIFTKIDEPRRERFTCLYVNLFLIENTFRGGLFYPRYPVTKNKTSIWTL